jgi:hypothetical protein
VALRDIVAYVNGEPTNPAVTVETESTCGLCGHKLIDPKSVERGIGPECANKPTGTKILHASAYAPSDADVIADLDAQLEKVDGQIAVLQAQRAELDSQRLAVITKQAQLNVTDPDVEDIDEWMAKVEAEGDKVQTVKDEAAKIAAKAEMETV